MKSFTKKILYLIVSVVLIFSVWLYVTSHFTKEKGNQTENIQQEGNNPLSSGVMPSKIASNPNKQEEGMATSNELIQKVENQEKYLSQNCKYLTKLSSLQDLIIQLRKSAYTDCLRIISNKELEVIWGKKIYEVHEDDFYKNENGIHLKSNLSESYQQALNKVYQNPNDAYVLLRAGDGKKFDTLYITGTKDYLRQYKGLNQWIPETVDNEGWNFVFQEYTDLPPYRVKPDLLPGFIEITLKYFYPNDNAANVFLNFGVDVLENNYIEEVEATIRNN